MFEQANLKQSDITNLGRADSIFFSEEEYKSIRAGVIEAPEQTLNLLDAFPIRQESPTKEFYRYTTLDDFGTAAVVEELSDFPELTIDGSKVTVQMPMKAIKYRLKKNDIVNSRTLGEPLDASLARRAGKKVKNLQDEALYSKSSAFGTLGIQDQATGAFGGTDWTTNTTNIFEQVRQWIDAIPVAFQQEAMTMLLYNTQHSELFRSTWNNGTDNINIPLGNFFKQIKETYPNLDIRKSQWVTPASGILYPTNPDVVERVIGIPVQNVELDQDFFGIVNGAIARDILVVYAPSAVVEATGI